MSLDISISLTDSDLKLFIEGIKGAQKTVDNQDEATIIAAARTLLEESHGKNLPDFVSTRLKHLNTMIAMVEDKGFDLPDADRNNVLASLAYFASPDDLLPDNIPVLGFLDDAIMIELCVRELEHEIEAYCDFRNWRDDEASRRGIDHAGLMLTRVDWAEARRVQAIERMHRKREESYASGRWAPVLFRVR